MVEDEDWKRTGELVEKILEEIAKLDAGELKVNHPKKEWEPWKEFVNKAPLNLPIYEPPCKNCRWFKPRVVTDKKGEFDSIIICTRNDMSHDFSCFNRD